MDFAGLLLLLAAGLVLFIALVSAWTAWTLTHPPRRAYAWAVSRNIPGDPAELLASIPDRPPERCRFDEWTFRSRARDLPVWEIPGDNPHAPAVIVTHGWGDSRIVALSRVPALLPAASRIILWDLPGHGEAPGSCTLGAREALDLLALVNAVAGRAGVQNRVVLMGFSMGAGVSIVAGAQDARVAAVIAEAPYRVPIVPARNVLALYNLPRTVTLRIAMALLGMRFGHGLSWALGAARTFDRARHARGLTIPLLVLHPGEDAVCPVTDGRDIAAAAPHAQLFVVERAAHTNLWTEPPFKEACAAQVRRFIAALEARDVPQDSSGIRAIIRMNG